MERDSLQTIQSKFPGSSRALWSEAVPNDGCVEEDTDQLTEFIHSHSDRLNRSVVLLSLNPAAVEPPGYQNFHSLASKPYDYRLKEFIQDNGLDNIIGANMTDIVPDAVDPDYKNIAPEEADTVSGPTPGPQQERIRHHLFFKTGVLGSTGLFRCDNDRATTQYHLLPQAMTSLSIAFGTTDSLSEN